MIPIEYREDPGLEFLQFCSHEDLEPLVEILTKGKKGKRWSGSLIGNKDFLGNRSNLTKAWRPISAEIQRYGADSIASLFRMGRGVTYREILEDVSRQMKIPFVSQTEIPDLETRLMSKILNDSLEKMTAEELDEFVKSLKDIAPEIQLGPNAAKLAPAAIAAAVKAALVAGGFTTYRFAVIVANAVSRAVLNRGLAFAGNAALTRGVAVLVGPVGWAISGILTVPVFTGPAFRVTVPATLYISYLRQKHLNKDLL